MNDTVIIILGNAWTVEYHTAEEDKRLDNCDGYCDWTTRLIVVEKEAEGNLGDMDTYMRKVLRHEIIHAHLLECGLDHASLPYDSWATNEEMIDWFARLGPSIYKVWQMAKAVNS